jgi:hypothetical protein
MADQLLTDCAEKRDAWAEITRKEQEEMDAVMDE